MSYITGPGVLRVPDAAKRVVMAQSFVSPAAVGSLFASKVGLGAAPLVPAGGDLIGTMVEPTWVGYARQNIVWAAPFQIAVGTSEAVAGIGTFTFPAGAAGAVVYYWFIVDSNGVLIFEYILNSSIGIIGAGVMEVPVLWDWTA